MCCKIYIICCMLMLIKNKKLIVLILSIICFCMNVSLVSAAANSDCAGFAIMSYSNGWWENSFPIVDVSRWTNSNKYSRFLTVEQQLAIIDKESLNTAMLNLKKYCCENELWWLSMTLKTCSKDKEFYNDNTIDSPYLFDHLFDVEMRRLSWLTGEYDIYKKIEMWSDDKWLEWRGLINEHAEDASGANPQVIMDKYKEFWKPSPPNLWYDISEKLDATFWSNSDDIFLAYVSGQWWSWESESVAEAFRNYNNWTLYDRYNNACAITEYLYALLDLWVSSQDKSKVINNISKWVCNQIVKEQLENENAYVQVIILQSGNLFLRNYRQWYISYLHGRTQNLQKIWSDATDRFLDIVRGVPHLVKTCVK